MTVTLLSIAATTSSGNADVASADSQAGGNSGNFLALLNTSIASQFNALQLVSSSASINEAVNNTHESGALTSQVHLATPPQVAKTVIQPVQQPFVKSAQQDNTNRPEKNNQNTTTQAQSSSNDSENNQNNTNNATTASQQQDSNSSTASNTQTDNALPSPKQLRSALKDQLQNIDQILSSVIQLLTASAATAPAPVATTTAATTTDTSATDSSVSASNANLLLASAAAGAQLPVTGSPIAGGAAAQANDLELLQEIQDAVNQLQQTLQDANEATTSGASATQPSTVLLPTNATTTNTSQSADLANTLIPNASAQATPAVPTDALEQALAQLAQLLTPQKSAGTTTLATAAATTPAAHISTQVADPFANASSTSPAASVLSLIKSSIADTRQQLQSLNGQNEAIFSQVQSSAQSLGFDPKQLFNNALANSGLTIKDSASEIAVSYSGAVTAAAQNTPLIPSAVTLQNDALLASGAIAASQNTSDNSNSDSGSSNQGQPQAQAITQTGAAQPQTTTTNASANFSKLLEQAAPKPVLDQVAFQLKSQSDGSNKIAIQLHPEDLGKVNIDLSVDANGKTSVAVTADNHHTLALLQQDSQRLSQALNDAGLKTDGGSLSFNLSNGQQQQQQQQQTNNQANTAQPAANYQNAQPEDEQESNLTVLTRSYVVNVTEGLDIQI